MTEWCVHLCVHLDDDGPQTSYFTVFFNGRTASIPVRVTQKDIPYGVSFSFPRTGVVLLRKPTDPDFVVINWTVRLATASLVARIASLQWRLAQFPSGSSDFPASSRLAGISFEFTLSSTTINDPIYADGFIIVNGWMGKNRNDIYKRMMRSLVRSLGWWWVSNLLIHCVF